MKRKRLPDKLEVGDVIAKGNGRPRVVRTSSLTKKRGSNISLSIRHCSWTNRPYTVYDTHELGRMGYRLIARGKPLRKKIDRELAKNIDDTDYRTLDCCDVRDLP